MSRTVDCTSQTRAGRLKKAKQFLETAEIVETMADDIDDVTDAYVTLLVHAGVAASDVICCAALGVHAQGESHTAAVKLLAKVDSTLANDLGALLAVKTKAGYSSASVSTTERTRAERAARRLVDTAEQR